MSIPGFLLRGTKKKWASIFEAVAKNSSSLAPALVLKTNEVGSKTPLLLKYSTLLAAGRRGFAVRVGSAGHRVFSRGVASSAAVSENIAGHQGTSLSVEAILAHVKRLGGCYYQLSKFRLSGLVVSTAAAGFVMGSGEVIDWAKLGWTSLGTMMAAASANSFNQFIEIAHDAKMKRTMGRPLPSGRISKAHAFLFAATLGVSGVSLLACKTNNLTAELGAANIALYVLAYTPLKQIHMVNTWVGAVVGAIPPLMGWAAASERLDPGSWVLASALYFWQIPHFMALAWLCRKDYAAGGYRMMSLTDTTGRRIAAASARNCAYLLPLGFAAADLGITTWPFAVENAVLAAIMGAACIKFYRQPSTEAARAMFRGSLLYLPLLMTAMLIHRKPNPDTQPQAMELEAMAAIPAVRHSVSTIEKSVDVEKIREWEDEKRDKVGVAAKLGRMPTPLPPVAFMSVAPFPFLPVPEYVRG